jgi:proteasome accessory factor PafA2
MALQKVCGIETEYGILVTSKDDASINASSMLINAYIEREKQALTSKWDFKDETPQKDARGFIGPHAPEVETHLVNCVLKNGARYYVDHAHPEYSTPECGNPLELVIWDKAGERILEYSVKALEQYAPDLKVKVFKNNSDGKGNSYGCHENYLTDRALPFNKIVEHLVTHLVSRQIYCGSGKVGYETPLITNQDVVFQISQRADFFEELVGLETTIKRPIVNTRDEPHANPELYRRLHVIVGDANISEISTFLKVGTTAVILAMIEDNMEPSKNLQLANPVKAIKQISYDPTLQSSVELQDGKTVRAIDLQWELYQRAKAYLSDHGFEAIGDDSVGYQLLELWENTLSKLENDLFQLDKSVDWIAKYSLILAYKEKYGLNFSDAKLKAIDLNYHDVTKERSLAVKLNLMKLVSEQEILKAISEPPESTRAYFRGKCLEKYNAEIVTANWDSIVFDIGHEPLRRVPMMDPLKGTRKHVETLISQCDNAEQLVAKLES